MGNFSGIRGWLVVAAVAGIAAAASGAHAWVSGPTISLGSNPMKTIIFEASFSGEVTGSAGQVLQPAVSVVKKLVYEVPQGQVFVLSGVSAVDQAVLPTGDYTTGMIQVLIDGAPICVYGEGINATGGRFYAFTRGEIAGPGAKIEAIMHIKLPANYTATTNFSLRGTLEKN